MCDTVVVLGDDGVQFAKNSDRDVNEAQIIEWHPGGTHPADSRVEATWIDIPQVPVTHSTMISRPWWMWGAEMGANSRGVVIGNEAVFTTESTKGERGLLGMDLLRLALERADDATSAVQVIVTLLEQYGQVGPCSHEKPSFTYHNSFLVADPDGAIVLETAGRRWATEQVRGPARSISNGLTIPGFAERYRDRLRGRVAACEVRRELTERMARGTVSAGGLMQLLRDNGTGGGPAWSPVNGSMVGPNMHGGGLLASSQTVASWVSDLRGPVRHWATGTADPALSLFKPLRVDEPTDLGPEPTNRFDPATLWWRHEPLHRAALRDWQHAVALIDVERDGVEARWLADPPGTEAAFAEAAELTERWEARIDAEMRDDTRPWWVRRRWRGFDRAAGLVDGAVTEKVS